MDFSTGITNILPSPIFPVRAASVIVAIRLSTSESLITISSLNFWQEINGHQPPRYWSAIPFCSPLPFTSVIVIPINPLSSSAFFTNSNRSGLITAFTIFMFFPPDQHRSPCCEMSRPTYSSSSETRKPMVLSITSARTYVTVNA